MRITITEILEFYDVPQLFVAKDAINTSYLCLTYDIDDTGVLHCLGASISIEKLNDFLTGHLDLRGVYTNPELYLYSIIVDGDTVEIVDVLDRPENYMLPEVGYYIDYGERENREMLRTCIEEGKTVLRIGYNYDTNEHIISAKVMTESLRGFQSIVTKVHKQLHGTHNELDSNLYVRGSIAASFDLELLSMEATDLFGGSKVSDTLQMISPLFSGDDEKVANGLTLFKSAQSGYRTLVKV